MRIKSKNTRTRKSFLSISAYAKRAKAKAREALHLIQTKGRTPRELVLERQVHLQRLQNQERSSKKSVENNRPAYEPFVARLKRPDKVIRELRNISKLNLGAKPISQLTVKDLQDFIA